MLQSLLITVLICFSCLLQGAAITYEFSGGRFGDNLLSYLHAKYISHKHKIPLLYKPFKYSSELILDAKELRYLDMRYFYPKEFRLNNRFPAPFPSDFLFVCPYFPEVKWELNRGSYFIFSIDWKDPSFRKIANEMVSVKQPLSLIQPPPECISIAVHMREGGGVDDESIKILNPLKVPPITFYIDALKRVLEIFPNQMIYCHVFTDALDPLLWINKIEEALPSDAPITFHYREKSNCPDNNVLLDFFSLFNFDVLIRAESNFSIVPCLIHDFALVLYPKNFSIRDKTAKIDQIEIDINEEKFIECQKK